MAILGQSLSFLGIPETDRQHNRMEKILVRKNLTNYSVISTAFYELNFFGIFNTNQHFKLKKNSQPGW
jgi:hypothetical protein